MRVMGVGGVGMGGSVFDEEEEVVVEVVEVITVSEIVCSVAEITKQERTTVLYCVICGSC